MGVAVAGAASPSGSREAVERRFEATDEILRIGELPLGGIEDVRPLLAVAAGGSMLDGRDLWSIAYALDGCDRLRRAVAQTDAAVLHDLARSMGTFDGWLRMVRERLDGDGEVRDDATPRLRDIRRRLRPLRGRIRDVMQRLLERHADAVQDPIVTLRRDRYVIPVQASLQSRVPGIVVDTSDSGRTVFVEPQSVVALNNELALLEFEERDEVRRILLELGRAIADDPRIEPTFVAVGELDAAHAAARLAEDWSLRRPSWSDDGSVQLPAARHPLVEGCIANDVVLDADRRLLMVTGPNAGGKTVLLKTVGVATLMARTGLFVAAGTGQAGPRLPWFARILADIGDEQSIEASLSTYAGHLVHLARIVDDSDEDTLVLIDELGSGTDPDEGAALSQAILERVLESGARGIVTTHLAPLKVFASDTTGVRNAAMRFDVDRLEPTFALTVGQPGRSYALAIARRMGLPSDVLDRSSALLGPEGERLERLLESLERQREELATRQAEAAVAERRALAEAEILRTEIDRLRAREDEVMADAAAKAEARMKDAIKHATRLARTARNEEGEERNDAVQELLRLRAEAQAQVAKAEARKRRDATDGRSGTDAIALGTRVRVPSYDAEGSVVDMRGDRLVVQLGLLRVEVGRHEVRNLSQGTSGDGSRTPRATRTPVTPVQPLRAGWERELNVRGERVEAALEQVRDFVLEAHALKVGSVRILHGKGTGTLRDAVRRYLKGERVVERFEDAVPYDGGHGVTVAYLRG